MLVRAAAVGLRTSRVAMHHVAAPSLLKQLVANNHGHQSCGYHLLSICVNQINQTSSKLFQPMTRSV